MPNLIQEREREVGERERRPSAAAAAEEEVPAGAMASMESRMEARKSGLARRGSGGDDGRRGYRYPSGRYRHWPGTDLAPVNVVVEGKRRWRNFPSA